MLTLLTDFGLSDVYVGVMKGVIAQVNPAVTVVDLTHQIPPQNLLAARFNLMNAYPYFPSGTVHVAVVDPGVGSQRRAIAIALTTGFLVGPDNGIFSGILSQNPAIAVVELTDSRYWRSPQMSSTFHGRDIFAPVGAYLAGGVPFEELGVAIAPQTLVELALPSPLQTDFGLVGCIQHIDHFGNLITNIAAAEVEGVSWLVRVGDRQIFSQRTYGDGASGDLLALVGSHGWVEIAVNGGSAQSRLQLNWKSPIQVVSSTRIES